MSLCLKSFSVAVLISAVGAEASACSIVFLKPWQNERVVQETDCSFKNGGDQDWIQGGASLDLGNGFVGQKIDRSVNVIDCNNRTGINISGPVVGLTSCGPSIDVDEIWPLPTGLVPTAEGRLADLAERASRRDLAVYFDVNERFKTEKRKDRFDQLCGCKLYYPDSPGAKL
ncbi:hypothetical protein [Ruegeria atlantica]|uniref:hypothetical protein n=1 Tax=Ruegeria atlantica TaxID=81569 RepID=UPI0014808C0E|nr:hypothetical protein [Ruegeria atlantica]